jgi:porphobilinogen deaminase
VSFAEAERQVEAAAAALARAGTGAAGWADEQRQTFDTQRMKPLAGAAATLVTALRKAQEAQQAIERLLGG